MRTRQLMSSVALTARGAAARRMSTPCCGATMETREAAAEEEEASAVLPEKLDTAVAAAPVAFHIADDVDQPSSRGAQDTVRRCRGAPDPAPEQREDGPHMRRDAISSSSSTSRGAGKGRRKCGQPPLPPSSPLPASLRKTICLADDDHGHARTSPRRIGWTVSGSFSRHCGKKGVTTRCSRGCQARLLLA